MSLAIRRSESVSCAAATPRLSILIPFFRYDPRDLLTALEAQTTAAPSAFEVILADDGSGDEDLAAHVRARIEGSKGPARLLALAENLGRARVRNLLAREARGRHLLLLDCDMLPVGPNYLAAFLELARADVDAAFGGFTVPALRELPPELRLHQWLQARGEALGARVRAQDPGKYVFTSNLLVRRELLLAQPFDERFSGWGWEDIEWGLRMSEAASVLQVEVPALHLGLDPPQVLIAKYAQSAANLPALLASRPEARRFPLLRAAAILARVPGRSALGRLLRRATVSRALPLEVRGVCAKLYRAFLYSSALGPPPDRRAPGRGRADGITRKGASDPPAAAAAGPAAPDPHTAPRPG